MSRYYRHNPDEPIRHDWTRPFDHAEDEADQLRDWRRDAAAEAALDKPMNCPHCKSGLLWSEDRGAHCDGCEDFDPESDLPEQELPLPGLEPGPDTLSPLDKPVAGTKPTKQQNEKPINQ